MEDKLFVNKFKLLFSSLFARSMPYVIIGCPNVKNNVFYFTNISEQEMIEYSEDPDYFVHKVEIVDEEFLTELYKRYPILKDCVLILDINTLLSTFNKCKDVTKFELRLDNGIVNCYIDNSCVIYCGHLASEFDTNLYHNIFESKYISEPTDIIEDIQTNINLVDFTILQVKNYCKVFYIANKSSVSTKEYFKKSNIENGSINIHVKKHESTVIVNYLYEDKFVKIISIQPGIIYYVL